MHLSSKTGTRKARALRRRMTLPEIILWRVLRTRPDDLKFRRQHPAGPYALDFYCDTAKLAIEVDGIVHDMGDRPMRDARRDAWLGEQGVATLRFRAEEVLNDLDAVLRLILAACRQPLHHPADGPPPLQGGCPGNSSRQGMRSSDGGGCGSNA